MEEYTEEIDSSAVRIREIKAHNFKLQEITEEIDEDAVTVHQTTAQKGQLMKSPTTRKVKIGKISSLFP